MSIDYLWTEDELTTFERESLFTDTTLTFIIISPNINQCFHELSEFLKPWCDEFPWNFHKPQFKILEFKEEFLYIYGELNYRDYIQDLNLLISIIFSFTRINHDCFIHFWDSDLIDPILFNCHDVLSEYLQDVTASQNRIWFHDYTCIQLNQHASNYLPLKQAVYQLSNKDFSPNEKITNKMAQLNQVEDSLAEIHDLELRVPMTYAKSLSNNPTLISQSLTELEKLEEINSITIDDTYSSNHGENMVDISVPVNTMNLGILLSIYKDRNQEHAFKACASGLIIKGLVKCGYSTEHEEASQNFKQNSRLLLQNILIEKQFLKTQVPENKDIYDVILNSSTESTEKEQKLAKEMEKIFEENKSHFESIIDEDGWIEEDEDEEDLTDEELNRFRWKVYDTTSEWLPKNEVKNEFDKFQSTIKKHNDEFKLNFKNSEFEDFPEFLESELMLEINKPSYTNESDYETDDSQNYQGEMPFSEYLKLKHSLRDPKASTSKYEIEDQDADWEDLDVSGDLSDSSDDSHELIEAYEENSRRIEEIFNGSNFPPSEENVEVVTASMRHLNTKND